MKIGLATSGRINILDVRNSLPAMTSEEKAREHVDVMLKASGWAVQTEDSISLSAPQSVLAFDIQPAKVK